MYKKSIVFLVLSGGIKKEHWLELDQTNMELILIETIYWKQENILKMQYIGCSEATFRLGSRSSKTIFQLPVRMSDVFWKLSDICLILTQLNSTLSPDGYLDELSDLWFPVKRVVILKAVNYFPRKYPS